MSTAQASSQRFGLFRRPGAKRWDSAVLPQYARSSFFQRHKILFTLILCSVAWLSGAMFALGGTVFAPILSIPILIGVSLIIWALPERQTVPEQALAAGLFLYLFGLLCWPDYLAIALPGLPWVTVIRLIGIPLCMFLLFCLSTSSHLRQVAKSTMAAAPLVWKGVVAFAALSFFSIFLSRDPGNSFSKFILAQVHWTGAFFISLIIFSAKGRAQNFARALWVIVVFVCLIGMWESRLQRLPWAGHIPSFLKIEDESVQRILAGVMRAGTDIYRVQSKFGTSLGLAEFLSLATPFVLHLAVTSRQLAVKFGASATLPLIGMVVYLTDSRLAAIGLFASLVLYLLYWSIVRCRRGGGILEYAIALSYPAIFAACFAATFLIGRIRAQVWGDGSQAASNDARVAMYDTGIPLILRNPIGHGLGEGAETLGFTNPAGILTIDTYYLAVALEVGVLGFLVYYGLFLLGIWKAARASISAASADTTWLGPAAIALANFVLSKSVFSNTENHPLAFIILGLIVALLYRASLEREDQDGEPAAPVDDGRIRTLPALHP